MTLFAIAESDGGLRWPKPCRLRAIADFGDGAAKADFVRRSSEGAKADFGKPA